MKTVSLNIRQTKAGQDYKQFVMEDGKRLSVFQFDTRYNDIIEGMEIGDDMLIYDQQYDNYKLKPLPKPAAPAGRGGFGGKVAEQVMEKKNENIKEAQTRKNDSIARAGAFRDATLVTLASLKEQPFPDSADFKREWESWVKYFLGKADEPFV